jgi:hypothetical protein
MMHARICRYEAVDWSLDELRRVGRPAGAALGTAPGFVSYAVLDLGDGALASVCIFETPAQLEAGERVLRAWGAAQPGCPLGAPVAVASGEVVVQRGMRDGRPAGSVRVVCGPRAWYSGSGRVRLAAN